MWHFNSFHVNLRFEWTELPLPGNVILSLSIPLLTTRWRLVIVVFKFYVSHGAILQTCRPKTSIYAKSGELTRFILVLIDVRCPNEVNKQIHE